MTRFGNFRDRARRSVAVCLVLLLAAVPLFAQEGAPPPGEGMQAPRTPFLGGLPARDAHRLPTARRRLGGEGREALRAPQEMGASVRYAAEASDG